MAITAAQVKELREKTGAGMMDCKKALTECEGDIAKAVDWLREKGIAKSAKKEGRIAAEGLTRVAVSGNTAVLFEVNSETDFVSKNEQFLGLMNTLQEAILANKPASTEEALNIQTAEGTINDLITTLQLQSEKKFLSVVLLLLKKQMMKFSVHTCTWVDPFLLL